MLSADGEGEGTDVGGVLAVVHEGDGIAVEVGVEDGGIEDAVGVAAEDEVDAARATDEAYVVGRLIGLPAEVAEADDHVAVLGGAQGGDGLVCLGNGVEIGDAGIVLLGYQPGHGRADAEHADAQPLALDDGVGLHHIRQTGGAEVVVGAEGGEVGQREDALHVLLAVVELVVADDGGIVVHGVHEAYLRLALEEVVEERALRVVAAVEEQQVGIDVLAEAVDEGSTAHVSSFAALGVRLDATVGVGSLENEERDILRVARSEQQGSDYRGEKVMMTDGEHGKNEK